MAFTLRFPDALERRVEVFDRVVDRSLDRVRGKRAFDRLFYGASALGDHGLIWLLLGAARGLRSKNGWHAAVRVGAGVGIESALVNIGIKSLFRRKRPVHEGLRPHHLRKPLTSSFPSGHATSAFTAAALLSDQDHLKPWYYGAAIIVAISRVYVRVHHASDVIAGVAVGAALGAAGRRIYPLPSPPDPDLSLDRR